MIDNIIEIKDLVKIYNLSEEVSVQALKGINISFKRGEFVAIMGSSGSGKSTFMNVLGFLDTPTSGLYMLDGIDGSSLNNDQKAEIRNRKSIRAGSHQHFLIPPGIGPVRTATCGSNSRKTL